MAKRKKLIIEELHPARIFDIRGQYVMLDPDLAELYGIEPKELKAQVQKNKSRFPPDFMFRLTGKEFQDLKSETDLSNLVLGQIKPPMAFTVQGVAMFSGFLNNKRAIEAHILLIRLFFKMEELINSRKDVLDQLRRIRRGMEYGEMLNWFLCTWKLCSCQLKWS